jgi:hypothetical protein
VDFTREPIIETVVTPREGYRLVVRSSKGAGSEEHFVDALEVVSFGSSVFFRSLERPKPFIVPVADYEVLEVREPRMVLKTPSEQAAKASGQRKAAQEQAPKQQQQQQQQQQAQVGASDQPEGAASQEPKQEREGRRRDRRRGFRRRRGGREEGDVPAGEAGQPVAGEMGEQMAGEGASNVPSSTPMLSSILPPPTKLIRDDLKRLREDYKGAFYITDEKDEMSDDDDASLSSLGTSSEEDFRFREAPFGISEQDIRMTEGGDAEVPLEGSFRPSTLTEEANSGTAQDVQKE